MRPPSTYAYKSVRRDMQARDGIGKIASRPRRRPLACHKRQLPRGSGVNLYKQPPFFLSAPPSIYADQKKMQQHRGRSRHISPVALARLASHSLEDQIQTAYALDNIRLAKILLLRLKGIHITDDADPRIDNVRDEDFDICFTPSGPLTLDDAHNHAVQESLRKQRQSWHESQRAQRLRARGILWEVEKSRLHDERCRALQKREHDAQLQRTRLAEKHRPTRVRVPIPPPTPPQL